MRPSSLLKRCKPAIKFNSIFYLSRPKFIELLVEHSSLLGFCLDWKIKTSNDDNCTKENQPTGNGEQWFFENKERVPFVCNSNGRGMFTGQEARG